MTSEQRKERQRQSALKSYYVNREEILLRRRTKWQTDEVFRLAQLANQKKSYKDNVANRKEQVRLRVEKNKEFVRNIKRQSKCARCSENHPACLDFHHKDPNEKDKGKRNQRHGKNGLHQAFDISWSIEHIKREISKCEILCANCHRKEHWSCLYSDDIMQ